MNVIVSNKQQNQLANLDIDIIKSITGVYEASEVVEMFKNFFYSRMILDVTAIRNFSDFKTYEVLVNGLDPEKIIFLLPEGSPLCTPNFLSHLISVGIYNFTTNINGIKYLLRKPNSYDDVSHIKKMAEQKNVQEEEVETSSIATNGDGSRSIIGVKNVTEHAGATTFIYLLKKELSIVYGESKVIAIEIGKSDFQLFSDKNMISTKESSVNDIISEFSDVSIVLIDLNTSTDYSYCDDVLYLVEPTTLKLNKLVRQNKNIFGKINGKKVILNKSLLLNNDISDFESEAAMKVFYNMPPLDERKRNAIINDFLSKLGLISNDVNNTSNKIFGLFRR